MKVFRELMQAAHCQKDVNELGDGTENMFT